MQTPDGKSLQQETILSFTPSVQRDQGARYLCRVEHVALEQPVEKSSAGLQVTGRSQPPDAGVDGAPCTNLALPAARLAHDMTRGHQVPEKSSFPSTTSPAHSDQARLPAAGPGGPAPAAVSGQDQSRISREEMGNGAEISPCPPRLGCWGCGTCHVGNNLAGIPDRHTCSLLPQATQGRTPGTVPSQHAATPGWEAVSNSWGKMHPKAATTPGLSAERHVTGKPHCCSPAGVEKGPCPPRRHPGAPQAPAR